jgi:hypothetical protein
VEAPVICCSANGEMPIIWPSVLYPYRSEEPVLIVEPIKVLKRMGLDSLSNPIALHITTPMGENYFFEQNMANSKCDFGDFETDAKMAYISLDREEQLLSFQMVHGSYLIYKGNKIALLHGSRIDASVQSHQVEIQGDFLTAFELHVAGEPQVLFNGREIEVVRSESTIYYQQKWIR